jgi:hypothetical protein
MLMTTFSLSTPDVLECIREASRHSLVVVDIQGVGDCYTDPQIHSIEGSRYICGVLVVLQAIRIMVSPELTSRRV